MTGAEQKLLDRAEKLRRALIEAEQLLHHGELSRAKQTIRTALNEDG